MPTAELDLNVNRIHTGTPKRYIGRLFNGKRIVMVISGDPKQDWEYRLPNAAPEVSEIFDWGQADDESFALAYSILHDHFGGPVDRRAVKIFRDEILAEIRTVAFERDTSDIDQLINIRLEPKIREAVLCRR